MSTSCLPTYSFSNFDGQIKIFRQLNFGRQRQLISSPLSHLPILHLYTPTFSLPTLYLFNIISQYKKWIDVREKRWCISVNIRSHFTRLLYKYWHTNLQWIFRFNLWNIPYFMCIYLFLTYQLPYPIDIANWIIFLISNTLYF